MRLSTASVMFLILDGGTKGGTSFYFVGGRKMGSISLSSWLKAAENEFRSISLVTGK